MGREAAPSVARARQAAPTTSLMACYKGPLPLDFLAATSSRSNSLPIDGMVRRAKRPSASGLPASLPGQVVQRAQIGLPNSAQD